LSDVVSWRIEMLIGKWNLGCVWWVWMTEGSVEGTIEERYRGEVSQKRVSEDGYSPE